MLHVAPIRISAELELNYIYKVISRCELVEGYTAAQAIVLWVRAESL